jgi:hypothetical protein
MVRPGLDAPVPKRLALELPLEQLPLGPLAPVLLTHAPLAQDPLSLPGVHTLILPSAGAVASTRRQAPTQMSGTG